VLPTPEEGLSSLGAFVRAARMARGITQARAAREARVSRKQLALLEKGGNVSVKFLLRLARYLDVTHLPLDGTVQLVAGQGGLNVFELLQALDLLAAFVEHLRGFAMDAVLPPSERKKLIDTPAFRDFVTALLGEGNAAGTERLAQAITRFTDDATGRTPLPRAAEEPAAHTRPARRSRKRSE
jgi:transcriptional regulator with XRE-family HTH domain